MSGLLPDLLGENAPPLGWPGRLSGCRLNRPFNGGLSFGGRAIVQIIGCLRNSPSRPKTSHLNACWVFFWRSILPSLIAFPISKKNNMACHHATSPPSLLMTFWVSWEMTPLFQIHMEFVKPPPHPGWIHRPKLRLQSPLFRLKLSSWKGLISARFGSLLAPY